MFNLVLNSTRHQRYQNGIPVMGLQFCKRMIKIENKAFKDLIEDNFFNLFDGFNVNPEKGFLVAMWNMDLPTPIHQMEPKLMEMIADTGDKILLRGITLGTRFDFANYGITLHLEKRNVVKCVLHMYDRGVDIEYDELVQRFDQINFY